MSLLSNRVYIRITITWKLLFTHSPWISIHSHTRHIKLNDDMLIPLSVSCLPKNCLRFTSNLWTKLFDVSWIVIAKRNASNRILLMKTLTGETINNVMTFRVVEKDIIIIWLRATTTDIHALIHLSYVLLIWKFIKIWIFRKKMLVKDFNVTRYDIYLQLFYYYLLKTLIKFGSLFVSHVASSLLYFNYFWYYFMIKMCLLTLYKNMHYIKLHNVARESHFRLTYFYETEDARFI